MNEGQNQPCRLPRPIVGLVPVLVALLLLGLLGWAKEQDPFVRKWFTLTTSEHNSFQCVAVLPKPRRVYPVIVYAHESGGKLPNDGASLQQMAELGLATISLEYNQTNKTAFSAQWGALLGYLAHQEWVNTNAIAWVGFNLGADRLLEFALRHPQQQPQVLVWLSGADLQRGQNISHTESLYCPVLLVHGELNAEFPLANTKQLASILQSNSLLVEQRVLSDASYDMEPERKVLFRCVGEYCRSHLLGKDAWRNYHSSAQRQAQASPLWLFLLPSAAWVVGCCLLLRHRKNVSPKKLRLSRGQITFRWLAILLATWALTETGIHLATPHFPVGSTTLSIARRFLVQGKQRADFEFLSTLPIWEGRPLDTLLAHVELAGYNRALVNWKLDDRMYRDFVLSPVITGNASEKMNWRRFLWEDLCPRVRAEPSLEEAARIVVRRLRGRVTISVGSNLSHEVPTIWLGQITDEVGFEIIYVAALRSVGIPARLDASGRATFWGDSRWEAAPEPAIIRL